MNPFFFFLFLVQSVAQGALPSNEKWMIDLGKSSGTIEFVAIGRPSALKIHGVGSSPRGNLILEGSVLSGSVIFALDSLETGIHLRNEHMKKKYLETEKFPEAKFIFTKITLPDSLSAETAIAEQVPFEGKLSLHGVEKTITGFAKIKKKSNEIQVNADFGLKISDYGVEIPKFAGITMAEDVQVLVQFAGPFVKSP